MIHHLVVGDLAAQPLKEAFPDETVVVLKDILHIGPLQKNEGQSFSELRTQWWREVAPDEKNPITVNDLERLLEVSTELNKNEEDEIWIWMAPWPADVSMWYWTLPYLEKHLNRIKVVSIAGLPFLDANGKVFFPKNISEILPKELVKARRLARLVTPSELEIDMEEWSKVSEEESGIRILSAGGGKKLTPQPIDHYDKQLLQFLTADSQKAHRVINQAMQRGNIPTGDVFLGWRLKEMAASETIVLKGDINKTLKDFEVKLPEAVVQDVIVGEDPQVN